MKSRVEYRDGSVGLFKWIAGKLVVLFVLFIFKSSVFLKFLKEVVVSKPNLYLNETVTYLVEVFCLRMYFDIINL